MGVCTRAFWLLLLLPRTVEFQLHFIPQEQADTGRDIKKYITPNRSQEFICFTQKSRFILHGDVYANHILLQWHCWRLIRAGNVLLRQVIWLGAIICGLYRCHVLCQPTEWNAAGTRPSLVITTTRALQRRHLVHTISSLCITQTTSAPPAVRPLISIYDENSTLFQIKKYRRWHL